MCERSTTHKKQLDKKRKTAETERAGKHTMNEVQTKEAPLITLSPTRHPKLAMKFLPAGGCRSIANHGACGSRRHHSDDRA